MPRLFVDEITSVGLVPEGDNPEAKVSFWKRKTQDRPGERAPTTPESHMDDYDLTGLDDSTKENVEKDLARLAELLEASVEEDDPVAEADPEVQAEFAKRDEEIAKLRDDLASERDQRLTAEFAKKAQAYPSLETEDGFDVAGGHLKELAKAAPDALDWLLEQLSAVEKIAAESQLFETIGRGDAGDARSQIDALARELMVGDADLTEQQARVIVRKQRRDLVQAEREENR